MSSAAIVRGGEQEPLPDVGHPAGPIAVDVGHAFAAFEPVDDPLHLQELFAPSTGRLGRPDDIVGTGPQLDPELPHVDVRCRVGDQADVAALVVIDVRPENIDGLDPVADQLLVLVELSGETGDVPDGVLIEVVLELLFEAGQVVVGDAQVEWRYSPAEASDVESTGLVRVSSGSRPWHRTSAGRRFWVACDRL